MQSAATRALSILAGRLTEASDDDLLSLIAARDHDAFRALWERYGAAMYSLCLRRLSDAGAAEDAAQEAFTSVWRRASTFDPDRGSAAGWLFAVARNAAAQLGRRNRLRSATLAVLDETDAAEAEDDLTRLAVHSALTRIPEAERRVLELAYFEDLTHVQIAGQLRLPLGTVKTRIRSGLRRLARHLEEDPL